MLLIHILSISYQFAARQQATAWTNNDQVPWRYMAPLVAIVLNENTEVCRFI